MSHTLGDLGTDWDFGRSSCGRHRFHSFFGNRWDALTKAQNPNINYNIILLIYIWIYIWIYIYIIRLSKYIILLIALLAVFLDRQMLDFNGSIFLEPAQLCAYFYKGHILTGKWKHMMASIFPDHQNQGWTCFFCWRFFPKLWVLPINCHQTNGFGNESFSLRRSILFYFIASTVQFTVVHGSKGVMLSCLLYLVYIGKEQATTWEDEPWCWELVKKETTQAWCRQAHHSYPSFCSPCALASRISPPYP